MSAARQDRSVMAGSTGHRPWPPPRSPWVMFMRWKKLAFLHWPLAPRSLRPFVPDELELDTFEGEAWLGITPFRMEGVRARLTPPLPGVSSFPELNVRTYVTKGGKAGIWFFSLDAASSVAVRAARLTFGLPYFRADMMMEPAGPGGVDYGSVRHGEHDARFRAEYRPTGPTDHAEPGTLEHWLTERYCLYTRWRGRLLRGEIHHDPWPLQPATTKILANTMAAGHGIELSTTPPMVHYAEQLDVVAWPPMPA